MAAGDGPEHIESTAMAEPTANSTMIEPDEEEDKCFEADLFKMDDMLAKMKLERQRATEKLIKEGRRVLKETLISERCTSCGMRILHMGRCDDCRICMECRQQRSRDGKCQVCAKLRCEKWLDNVDQSLAPDSVLESRAMDVPAHQHDRINPNDELEKHQSRPNATNSKPEVEKLECAASSLPTMPATEEPENDKDVVALWEFIAMSLSTMQPAKLELDDDSQADILNAAVKYMEEVQPYHEGEGALPGIDIITVQNEARELDRIKVVPLKQMERLLCGIPDAQVVAFFILSHLPEEHHALLSCTTIFAEEHTPIWRTYVLFEMWPEEESDNFACQFSRLVPGQWTKKFILQKWDELCEASYFETVLLY